VRKIDFNYIEPAHRTIHDELLNWAKWGQTRPHYQVCPMFRMAKTNYRQWHLPEISVKVDSMGAAKIEKAVCKLPEAHRKAIKWAYITKTAPGRSTRGIAANDAALQQLVRDGRQMLKNRLAI